VNQPKVSICVPTYNTAKYISETIESLKAQDYPNFEIIVVDNGSTDGTTEILAKTSGIRHVLFKTLTEHGQNWNRCFDLAEGEYMAIYHSDDVYEKNIVSKQVEYLETHPSSVAVFASATKINQHGKVIGSLERPEQLGDELEVGELIRYSATNGYFPLICPTFMVRTKPARDCGGFDAGFVFAHDMDYYMRLFYFGNIGFLKEKLIRYRQHPMQGSVRFNEVKNTQIEFFVILKTSMSKYGIALTTGQSIRFKLHECRARLVDFLTGTQPFATMVLKYRQSKRR
jgi:glycosyltransferase involved in cell wall biosynthesis